MRLVRVCVGADPAVPPSLLRQPVSRRRRPRRGSCARHRPPARRINRVSRSPSTTATACTRAPAGNPVNRRVPRAVVACLNVAGAVQLDVDTGGHVHDGLPDDAHGDRARGQLTARDDLTRHHARVRHLRAAGNGRKQRDQRRRSDIRGSVRLASRPDFEPASTAGLAEPRVRRRWPCRTASSVRTARHAVRRPRPRACARRRRARSAAGRLRRRRAAVSGAARAGAGARASR